MFLDPYSKKAYRSLPVCLLVCLLSTFSHASGDDQYLLQLLKKAEDARLSEERPWRLLLHFSGEKASASKIDDPVFFLSETGKKDPDAELAATVKGLFKPVELGDRHPRCRYPARYSWLREQLEFDEKQLPDPDCAEQKTYLDRVKPRSASLMFPSGYMNSPASMFGHTFIRIDSDNDSELLSHAVNYAARTDESNGMVYAWKGIFGLYKGYFSILPQYVKIREYSNLEHRDIWEYRLDLDREEVERMALHIWELREIYSDYFFFDENCSYHLLFLLENARPSLHLTDRTPPWVMPLDTVTLVRSAGLIAKSGYRPSQREKIQAISSLMQKSDISLAARIADREEDFSKNRSRLPPRRSVPVLDLSIELLQYSYAKKRVNQDDYRKLLLSLLRERSRYGSAAVNNYNSISQPHRPEEGHSSARVSIGGGFDRGKPFIQAGIRPAYHSLIDPDTGYVKGAQIQFLDSELRYYPRQEHLRLERLSLVDIISLSTYDRLFPRTSWKIIAGFDQLQKKNGHDTTAFRINAGVGVSADADLPGIAYAMAEVDANIGEGLNDWYALGGGFSAGIITNIGNRLKLHLSGKSLWYPVGEERLLLGGEAAAGFSITRNNSLEAIFRYSDTSGHGKSESLLIWNHFF
ncbi:MAG: hypothetical protein A2079_06295 [Geobacteraceae bacterium GWC2_48_7]|nr:MAG: hypothetical protein A2079_06295 [Geobacteraceae bacterium GWC2_48_7]